MHSTSLEYSLKRAYFTRQPSHYLRTLTETRFPPDRCCRCEPKARQGKRCHADRLGVVGLRPSRISSSRPGKHLARSASAAASNNSSGMTQRLPCPTDLGGGGGGSWGSSVPSPSSSSQEAAASAAPAINASHRQQASSADQRGPTSDSPAPQLADREHGSSRTCWEET